MSAAAGHRIRWLAFSVLLLSWAASLVFDTGSGLSLGLLAAASLFLLYQLLSRQR